MIITDGVHLASDSSVEELHEFAEELGFHRDWFQDHRYPHYDLTTKSVYNRAVEAGAMVLHKRELIRRVIHT